MGSAGDAITKYSWGDGKKAARAPQPALKGGKSTRGSVFFFLPLFWHMAPKTMWLWLSKGQNIGRRPAGLIKIILFFQRNLYYKFEFE